MADTFLKALREDSGFALEHLAAKLETTVDEYSKIELGLIKPNYAQAGLLGELYNIDPKHILGIADSVTYNIGEYSRTIYSVNYYEKAEPNPSKNVS